ncbi:defensin-like protein 1 [Mangifera indica]|uniref:defensin-like protein 1 n=1 Tax=Mangifera indica TaxID=29780 RepID=UPI001CFBD8C5|nr:defensin-like protein 1 [Mangifera indica]
MAKTLKSVRFIDLFFFIILVANLEMTPGVEAKVCKRYSKTWRGPCFSISNCNKQCKKKEKAVSGSCHADDVGWACFCYVNC